MRIAVVGPTHPLKGGVALHTAHLCRELSSKHHVELVRWRSPYPGWLYRGELGVPDGVAETAVSPEVVAELDWWNPGGWWRAGRQVSSADVLVIVLVVPAQVPALRTLCRAARRRGGPRVVVIAHNVLPHERHYGDAALVRRMFAVADTVVVHSVDDERRAEGLGIRAQVVRRRLPPHLPDGLVSTPLPAPAPRLRILQLGTVREYKGTSTILDALQRVDDVELVIAGEFWVARADIGQEVARRGLGGRVRLVPRYLSVTEINELAAACDVMVLPYLTSTGSQNVDLARALGRPVIASRVGSFAEVVNDGSDGYLVEPGDPRDLAAALVRMQDPDTRHRLVAASVVDHRGWSDYIAVLTGHLA